MQLQVLCASSVSSVGHLLVYPTGRRTVCRVLSQLLLAVYPTGRVYICLSQSASVFKCKRMFNLFCLISNQSLSSNLSVYNLQQSATAEESAAATASYPVPRIA